MAQVGDGKYTSAIKKYMKKMSRIMEKENVTNNGQNSRKLDISYALKNGCGFIYQEYLCPKNWM